MVLIAICISDRLGSAPWVSGRERDLLKGTLGGRAMADGWEEDLSPVGASEWTPERARHLLNRAGFGGLPEEAARLAAMSPEAAVASFVDFEAIDDSYLPLFDPSEIYDPSLTPFPATRPAATRLAEETGAAMGVSVKPAGQRRLQPVADRWFFWVRASMLETRRVTNWWADRMVATNRPLQEKLALFWHGHFASSEEKVRDYRKMLGQVLLFQRNAAGNFGALLSAVGYFRAERFGGLQIDDRLISEKRDLSHRTGSRTTIAAGAPASLL
jgi:uncharacterized protein (DUF1800 family)